MAAKTPRSIYDKLLAKLSKKERKKPPKKVSESVLVPAIQSEVSKVAECIEREDKQQARIHAKLLLTHLEMLLTQLPPKKVVAVIEREPLVRDATEWLQFLADFYGHQNGRTSELMSHVFPEARETPTKEVEALTPITDATDGKTVSQVLDHVVAELFKPVCHCGSSKKPLSAFETYAISSTGGVPQDLADVAKVVSKKEFSRIYHDRHAGVPREEDFQRSHEMADAHLARK